MGVCAEVLTLLGIPRMCHPHELIVVPQPAKGHFLESSINAWRELRKLEGHS